MLAGKYHPLVFVISLLLALHFLSYGWFWLVVSRHSMQQQLVNNGSLGRNCDIWIMGDSHPLYGLDPKYLPGSQNLAATSENYVLNYFKIKHSLKAGQKPQLIIIPAEYHSFSKQGLSLLWNHELDDLYWSEVIEAQELAKDVGNSEPIRWKIAAKFFPYAGQYYRAITGMFQEPATIDSLGFIASSEVFDRHPDKIQEAKSRAESHAGKFNLIDPLQIRYLQKIKVLCEREGIKLVAIRYPIHPIYRQCMEKRPEVQAVDTLIISQFFENSDVAGLYDYRRLFNEQSQYFCDPDHLNETGAQILTEKFRKTVLPVLLEKDAR